MGYYFDDSRSINAYEGSDPKAIISAMAHRYMGQNLEHGLYYRAYTNSGIVRTTDYRYIVDFNKIFPDAKDKDCVWAFAKVWMGGGQSGFDINCFGPMVMYVNGDVVYKSDIFKERYSETATRVFIDFKEGWNDIRIRFQKTKAGFGAQFGTWIGKWDLYVLMPSKERDGREGWLYTELVDDKYEPNFVIDMSEKDVDVKLYPCTDWKEEELALHQMARMYGNASGRYAVGWTKAFFDTIGVHTYSFKLNAATDTVVYLDKEEVYKAGAGVTEFTLDIPFGEHDIAVKSAGADGDWGYTLESANLEFKNPARTKGTSDAWIYIGTFDNSYEFEWDKAFGLLHVIGEPKTYWRLDERDTFVRPYNENTLFGRWNYPLGVTIYGLLHTARLLNSQDMLDYIRDHIQLCCDTFEYALWDKEQYGGATAIHNLLTSIDSLDDCGSFASAMLEADKYLDDLKDVKPVADYVGDYIFNHQSRLEDGTFYRKDMMHHFHNQTLWADDLYMSVPFLVRYYQYTGDRKYIDDAARQFFGFKKRLYMPEEQIMSHVYDFKYDTKTNVPWGRGNGWVVFSMTELLEVLPEDHELRDDLIEFLNTLGEGWLKLQGPDDMWHQVLNDWESYPETSCTSMFIYAFSRAVRFGWVKNPEKYVKAIYKAWEAISKISVDTNGNVYGVCRGSEFSFIPDYYKYELGWNLNDTHGTGIVMLAGIEIIRLNEYLTK